MYPNEKIEYSDFTVFSQPLKGPFIRNSGSLQHRKVLTPQAFSYSKFDLKTKKYLERRFLTNANPYFRTYFPL